MTESGYLPREFSALLYGVKILTTRPAHQGDIILAKLRACGAEARNFPTIYIAGRFDADNLLKSVAGYDLAIFISANAVEHGLAALVRLGISRVNLPPVVTVGPGTASVLESRGITGVTCPSKPSSESLLQMPAIQGLGSSARVILFRGVGGKELIAKGMRARGIEVDYAEVYERRRPNSAELSFADFYPDLILVTSRDGLQNLYAMAAGEVRDALLRTPVLLGSRSMLGLHAQLGFKQLAGVATSPLDEDMFNAVLVWRRLIN